MTERDDEVWRAIVENYGERAALDDLPAAESGDTLDAADGPSSDPSPDSAPDTQGKRPGVPSDVPSDVPDVADDPDDPDVPDVPDDPDATIARALAREEGFVPPPPPPLPYVAPPRLVAGIGVFGAPLVLLVCVIGGFWVPGWLGYLLVAAFVGGFAYLVAHMKKRPDDPWDDGARV